MISVVIPCYNEEKRIKPSLKKIVKYLSSLNTEYELVTVNDGSQDKTLSILEKAASENSNIRFVSYPENQGKGFAVKSGVEAVCDRSDYVMFIDADLAADLTSVERSLKVFSENKDCDIVISNRRRKDSKEEVKFFRRVFSFGCRLITIVLTGLTYQDTQSGFKAFKTQCIKEIVKKQKIFRFAFDVEYLYIAKLMDFRVLEIPVIYRNQNDNSSVHVIRDSLKFFKDLAEIRHNKRFYRD